ncbi:MAG: hypothetical protein H5T69_06070 [Chloroflexi bacterium]|nr:hypothetical protein [Chloroflexota bacterium]
MNSKLGFHIQRRRHGWPNVVADAVPAIVKSLEWSIIDEWIPEEQSDLAKRERAYKWTSYNVFLLGRYPVFAQSLDEPADRAYEFWHRLLDGLSGGDPSRRGRVLERMRLFHAWEGYNEIGNGPDVADLGRFDAALARYFHEEGIRYAGGGFSMTKPTLEEWPDYYRALLDEVHAGRGDLPDFLHLHEYWFPRSDWATLLNEDGSIHGERMREATRGYMLHWRELYEHPDTPDEIKLPVILSEVGWDQGWPEQVGYRRSPCSDEEYLKWLIWYDQELQKPLNGIDYVVGAAIYTYGHEARWGSFEIDQWQGRGILDMLRAYLREANREPHPWDWQAAWGEAPSPVEESHFVLFAQEVSLDWRHALDNYLQRFRVTNGQSLDDALRIAAEHHHVTLVGSAGGVYGVPAEWEEEIRRRQPRTEIDRLEGLTVEELRRAADERVRWNDRYGRQIRAMRARTERVTPETPMLTRY